MTRETYLKYGLETGLLKFLEYLELTKSLNLPEGLEKAASEYISAYYATQHREPDMTSLFIAGAEWRYQKDRAEFAKLKAKEWSDGYNEGITKGKEQMMKEAVETEVFDFSSNSPQPYAHIALTPNKYHTGDKVRIIIVKEEDRDGEKEK